MVAMLALVVYGKVRALPFTLVRVTTGADVSTLKLCGVLVPTLPTLSPCVAVTVKLPLASVGDAV
jgi:hypothetical protein